MHVLFIYKLLPHDFYDKYQSHINDLNIYGNNNSRLKTYVSIFVLPKRF